MREGWDGVGTAAAAAAAGRRALSREARWKKGKGDSGDARRERREVGAWWRRGGWTEATVVAPRHGMAAAEERRMVATMRPLSLIFGGGGHSRTGNGRKMYGPLVCLVGHVYMLGSSTGLRQEALT